MGHIGFINKISGIIKDRTATAIGALKRFAGRIPAPIRRIARVGRLATPAGIALAVAPFIPRIIRGIRGARAPIQAGIAKTVGFLGGTRVAAGVTTGGIAGLGVGIFSRPGAPVRPGMDEQAAIENAEIERMFKAARPRARRRAPAKRKVSRRRKRIPAHGHKVISVPVRKRKKVGRKKRTHSRPRHKGHKRVKFTTADGRKVSFLTNPKARH